MYRSIQIKHAVSQLITLATQRPDNLHLPEVVGAYREEVADAMMLLAGVVKGRTVVVVAEHYMQARDICRKLGVPMRWSQQPDSLRGIRNLAVIFLTTKDWTDHIAFAKSNFDTEIYYIGDF